MDLTTAIRMQFAKIHPSRTSARAGLATKAMGQRVKTLMNATTTTMEAASTNASTFQAITAALVLMASCWRTMAIIVSMWTNVFLTMEDVNIYVLTQWEVMNADVKLDSF